ncbi:MAG: hypothetical protein ABR986_11645, partial [Methanomassiliicoccales archaeon]
FIMTSQYAILWTLSSLLFCVFSILFIVMPTTRPVKEQEPKEAKAHIDAAKVLENKKLLGLAFWNSFFINSQPMAFGIIAIFSVDIPLIAYLAIVSQVLTWEVTLLLLLQSAGMILFYVGIVRMKPYDTGFLEQVWSVGKSVADMLKGRSVKRFKNVFFTVLFLSVFVVSLAAAMLMPGSSVKMLRGDANVDLAKEFVPLVIIFLSQFLLVRETQSAASRRMAENLLRKKLSMKRSRDGSEETGLEDLEEQMPMYFKVVRHDILGFMPVYMMNPDLGVIFRDQRPSENHPVRSA